MRRAAPRLPLPIKKPCENLAPVDKGIAHKQNSKLDYGQQCSAKVASVLCRLPFTPSRCFVRHLRIQGMQRVAELQGTGWKALQWSSNGRELHSSVILHWLVGKFIHLHHSRMLTSIIGCWR